MKAGRAAAAAVFCALVFALSFLVFFPFGQGAELIWLRTVRAAGERGFALDAAYVSASGFLPSAELANVRFKSVLLSGEAGKVTASLSLKDSIAALAPVLQVRFERVSANVPVPGESPLYLDLAEGKVALRPGRLEAFELRASGDLEASGRAVFTPSPFSLAEADISLGGRRANLLEALGPVLPLRRGEGGIWRLRKGGRGSDVGH